VLIKLRLVRAIAKSLAVNLPRDFQFTPFFSINICLELSGGVAGLILAEECIDRSSGFDESLRRGHGRGSRFLQRK
jgi:hypothetical protein